MGTEGFNIVHAERVDNIKSLRPHCYISLGIAEEGVAEVGVKVKAPHA